MILCEVFLRDHLSNDRSIYMFVSGRVRVGGLGDALYSCRSIHAPVLGLIVSLGIGV